MDPADLSDDPIEQFGAWFDAAVAAGVRQPDAMTVATSTRGARVTARTVLLRGVDGRGFAFYTNLESVKADDLRANAALVFHWREQQRQVRVVGPVARIEPDEVARYWRTRPREHQLSAWASEQSRVVPDRTTLERAHRDAAARFPETEPVPVPPFWGGFRVGAEELELWEARPGRLHDRVRYRREPAGWIRERLAP